MRILLAFALFPLLTTFAPAELFREPVPPTLSQLAFERLPLDERDPARRKVGRLIFLDGWRIRSNDARFGGISAMHVEGKSVTALSDSGSLIRFELGGDRASIIPLPDGPGESSKKGNRDSEALVVRGPDAWVGFELTDQVWRYRRSDWSAVSSAAPAAMKHWRGNSGSEAMLRLPGGRFLIFSEGKDRADGTTEALLFEGDPSVRGTKTKLFGYRAPEGYRITDAALLPDGRMLFLNRRFAPTEGFLAMLTLSSGRPIAAGMTLSGTEIALLRPPLTTDNMEALSVTREKGRTIVWIASDDNFFPLQRTLLLKFALAD